jgi:hypothetical protein
MILKCPHKIKLCCNVSKKSEVRVIHYVRVIYRKIRYFVCSRSVTGIIYNTQMTSAHAGAQLVQALCYKPESRGFDSRWCHRNFSLTLSFRPRYIPGVNSDNNRIDHLVGKGSRCAGLTTLPPQRVDRLEIPGASNS